MLMPDISLWLGYCFDISLLSLVSVAEFGLNTLDLDISFLLSLVSNANADESELVLCSCMISMFIYYHYSISFDLQTQQQMALNIKNTIVVYPYAYSNKKQSPLWFCKNTVTASLLLQRVSFSLVNFTMKMCYMWQGVVIMISRQICNMKITANLHMCVKALSLKVLKFRP